MVQKRQRNAGVFSEQRGLSLLNKTTLSHANSVNPSQNAELNRFLYAKNCTSGFRNLKVNM